MKKKRIISITLMIILPLFFAFALFLVYCGVSRGENYEKYRYDRHYFNPIIFSTIDYKSSQEEKDEVADIMELAKQVFTYTGNEENADKNVGALSRYYYYSTDAFPIARVDLKIELLTAKAGRTKGYMWVVYSVGRYNDKGEHVSGSGDIPSYWKIEKKDGRWLVTDITEPA